MNLRVTAQTQTANALANLRRQAADVTKFQEQITSGVKVQAASDNPTAFSVITTARAANKRASTYQETITDSTTDLNAGVSALGEANDTLVRATQIAIEGAGGTLDSTGYEALANEVDRLFDNLLNSANRQQDGKYLFGGTAADTPPFRVGTLTPEGRPATIAYDGAPERARSLVSKSQTVDTKYVGGEVFQTAGQDVFAALIGLRDDLRNPAITDSARTAALSARLGDLQTARDAVGEVVGEQASSLAGLEAISTRLSDLKLSADLRAGDLESTDYAEAILKLNQQDTAFQATLSVSAKLLQPSLLDFIR